MEQVAEGRRQRPRLKVTIRAVGSLVGLLVVVMLIAAIIYSTKPQEQGFKAALSRQLSDAVARGDTPGVVALVVGRDGVLYEGAAGTLDHLAQFR